MQLSTIATKWSLLVMTLAFLALAAGIVTVVNAHDGDATMVHACVNTTNGQIRIADPGPGDADTDCAVVLFWQQQLRQ